ncbi:MAG: ribosomal-processing cysteine protease Prp [Lachnospiraceae bacterium]
MIKVIIYQDSNNVYCGFRMEGHAGFAASGSDIVCSAVSVLVINTMNSIEQFTNDQFNGAVHKEKDVVSFEILSEPASEAARLLMDSLVLGLKGIQDEYGEKYIKIRIKRKQGA